eukprot:scaffold499_cov335-Pavlova_lutheri.AAC.51
MEGNNIGTGRTWSLRLTLSERNGSEARLGLAFGFECCDLDRNMNQSGIRRFGGRASIPPACGGCIEGGTRIRPRLVLRFDMLDLYDGCRT